MEPPWTTGSSVMYSAIEDVTQKFYILIFFEFYWLLQHKNWLTWVKYFFDESAIRFSHIIMQHSLRYIFTFLSSHNEKCQAIAELFYDSYLWTPEARCIGALVRRPIGPRVMLLNLHEIFLWCLNKHRQIVYKT